MPTQVKSICPKCHQQVIVGARSILFNHQYCHFACAERAFWATQTVDGCIPEDWYTLATEERIRILEGSRHA